MSNMIIIQLKCIIFIIDIICIVCIIHDLELKAIPGLQKIGPITAGILYGHYINGFYSR